MVCLWPPSPRRSYCGAAPGPCAHASTRRQLSTQRLSNSAQWVSGPSYGSRQRALCARTPRHARAHACKRAHGRVQVVQEGLSKIDALIKLQKLDPVPAPPEVQAAYRSAKATLCALKLKLEVISAPPPGSGAGSPSRAAGPATRTCVCFVGKQAPVHAAYYACEPAHEAVHMHWRATRRCWWCCWTCECVCCVQGSRGPLNRRFE